jgi:hypothetical protein
LCDGALEQHRLCADALAGHVTQFDLAALTLSTDCGDTFAKPRARHFGALHREAHEQQARRRDEQCLSRTPRQQGTDDGAGEPGDL